MTLNRLFNLAIAGAALAAMSGLGTRPAIAGQTHKTKLTAAQAESAALKKYKKGHVQGKTALENEEGKWQYAVMVKVNGKLHEVMVDANSGKIASEETVTAKEEAAEKRAEEAGKKHGKSNKPSKDAKAEKDEGKEDGEKGEKK